MMAASVGTSLPDSENGDARPVSAKKKTTPIAHTSAAGVRGRCANISGARPASTMSMPYLRNVLMVYSLLVSSSFIASSSVSGLSPEESRFELFSLLEELTRTPSPTSAIFTSPSESTSRFSGLRSLCAMRPPGLFGSCSQAIPSATSLRISNRRSTGMESPKRTTCSRNDSAHSSSAMKTCDDVAAHRWKKGTRGDWFKVVKSSTSRSTKRRSSRPSSPGGRAMRFTATACRARVVCCTYPRKTYVPDDPTPTISSSL
mmetsp:Transcript_15206/g.65104  ORF Transcript_15206/g.65104 Transcript_15206/m.65104 type:complete len:259 (-) Transcript_15206:3389-4165(-)